MFHGKLITLAMLLAATGCTYASPVMKAADGTYFVATHAAPAAGGVTGAYSRASLEATKFCAAQGGSPVLVNATDRAVYQSGFGGGFSGTPQGGYNGSAGGLTMAAGQAGVHFRCE